MTGEEVNDVENGLMGGNLFDGWMANGGFELGDGRKAYVALAGPLGLVAAWVENPDGTQEGFSLDNGWYGEKSKQEALHYVGEEPTLDAEWDPLA